MENTFLKERDRKVREEVIERFSKAVISKIVTKYCAADITSQYIGMQTCEWIRAIAKEMKEE